MLASFLGVSMYQSFILSHYSFHILSLSHSLHLEHLVAYWNFLYYPLCNIVKLLDFCFSVDILCNFCNHKVALGHRPSSLSLFNYEQFYF
jgi:hypothetical protein